MVSRRECSRSRAYVSNDRYIAKHDSRRWRWLPETELPPVVAYPRRSCRANNAASSARRLTWSFSNARLK